MEDITFDEITMRKKHLPEPSRQAVVENEMVDPIRVARSRLLDLWLDDLENSAVCKTVSPDIWRRLVHESAETGRPLLLAGVACPTWAQVGTGPDDEVEFLRLMPFTGRPLRFARSLTSFQSALNSFGVAVLPCLAVSQVEALMWQKLGSDRVMSDAGELKAMLGENQQTLALLCEKAGCRSVFFDHLDLVKRRLGVSTDASVLSGVSTETDISGFVRELIRTDVRCLPDELRSIHAAHGVDPVGVVWLDLMAKDVDEERVLVKQAVLGERSDLAAITPFRNVSRWSSGVEPQDAFLDRVAMMSKLLGIQSLEGRPREVWLREVLALPDETVEQALRTLGVVGHIGSVHEKNQAVSTIERILFNEATFAEASLEQRISVDIGTSVIDALSRATGQSKGHLRGFFASGLVTVNEVAIGDGRIPCENDMLLSIGKRTRVRVGIT
jgi:hypothetical protein